MKILIQRKGRNEEEEEFTTPSEKSEKDFKSDTSTEDEQETNTAETLQVHHGLNETIHDEDNTSEDENVAEMQTYENNGEQNK